MSKGKKVDGHPVVEGEAFGAPVPGRWPGGGRVGEEGVIRDASVEHGRDRSQERRVSPAEEVFRFATSAMVVYGLAILVVVGLVVWMAVFR